MHTYLEILEGNFNDDQVIEEQEGDSDACESVALEIVDANPGAATAREYFKHHKNRRPEIFKSI